MPDNFPAGIPIVFPGEVLTEHALQILRSVMESGGRITGATDSKLQQLCVIIHDAVSLGETPIDDAALRTGALMASGHQQHQ